MQVETSSKSSNLLVSLDASLKQLNIQANSSIIVAYSGGLDSSCLLYLLKETLKTNNIIAANFNHKWSNSSEKALEVIKRNCEKLKIKYELGQSSEEGRSSENKARDERYNFLVDVAKRNNAKHIFMAHHLDDQIETFFFRLLRGSSLKGLSGIPRTRALNKEVILSRPLLNVPKVEIEEYCKTNQIEYWQDPSNQDNSLSRNFIRNKLVPLLKELEPSFAKQISNTISIIESSQNYLEAQALPATEFLDIYDLRKIHPALQRETIKKFLEGKVKNINFETIESTRELINFEADTRCSLSGDYEVIKKKNKLELYKKEKQAFTNIQIKPIKIQANNLFEKTEQSFTILRDIDQIQNNKQLEDARTPLGKLHIKKEKVDLKEIKKSKNSYSAQVDFTTLKELQLEIRERKAGDMFWPINCKYKCKLKDFLINRKARNNQSPFKIPVGQIVLAIKDSSEILWIPGVEVGEQIKVKANSTHSIKITLD